MVSKVDNSWKIEASKNFTVVQHITKDIYGGQ